MTRFLLPLLLALIAPVPSSLKAQALPSAALDRIVAVVEEDVILRSELDRAISNIERQYADAPDQLPPRSALERQVLERLVLQRLQTQRAESIGIRVGENELESALQSIAAQNGVDMARMREQLERDGFSFRNFRENVREEMMTQRLRSRVMQTRVSVSDTEVDILLARGSLTGEQLDLAYLLVAVPDGATPEQLAAAREKVDGIRTLIAEGMDFSAAAIRYSDAANALEGGNVGWRRIDEVPPAFATLLQDMQPGEVSQPLRGPSGFQLIHLRQRRDGAQQRMVIEIKLRDILVRVTELVDESQALAKIQGLRDRIAAGESFEALAREHSQNAASAAMGGDLGWVQAESLPPDFNQAIQSLVDGQISQPLRSQQGWHLVLREATREQDRTQDLLREEARQIIARRKADEEFERYLRQMRDEAFVDTRLSAN